ncbi:MAG: DUF4438 domain-containing protein [Thermosediminibacteraceae bacterium]|nr:DUF4438 domain-containing protein [Thermosediminibacteraceae bacterium]
MLRTNIEKTVIQSVQGKIHHPVAASPFRIGHDGSVNILPATGGITYNVSLGDPAFGWSGDHIEPGVSIRNEDKNENNALMMLSCIGNEARVVTGDAKGAKGVVIGKHGGIEHVIVQFKKEDMEKMAIDDKILIKAWGQGLKLLDYPDIVVMNIDPRLFLKIPIIEENGILKVPVVAEAPAHLMGSGLGAATAFSGDYDIMTSDKDEIQKLGLDRLRFGDLVLLKDCDNTYGRGYLKGAVTIGVVIHSDCIKMGHGPGITTIMTCKTTKIKGIIDKDANIMNYMDYLNSE